MHRKFQVGCPCCCPDCETCSNYIPGYTIDDYTQVAGTWTISTNIATSSSNAILIHDTGVPSAYHGGLLIAGWIVPGATPGIVWDLRFVFLYGDSNNYCYVKCTQSGLNGEFSVWEVVDGSHYQAGSPYTFSSGGKASPYAYTLSIYYDEAAERVYVIGAKDLAATSLDQCLLLDEQLTNWGYYGSGNKAYGTQVGFATGTVDASYDPVQFYPSWTAFDLHGCDESPCDFNTYNQWPIQLQIELQGFSASADPCPICADLNAVYLIDQERVSCSIDDRSCDYSLEDADASCGTNPFNGQPYPLRIHAYFFSDSDDECGNAIVKLMIAITAQRSGSPSAGTISGWVALPSECGKTDGITNVQSLEIALDTLDTGGWEFCDYTNAKAIVTAS